MDPFCARWPDGLRSRVESREGWANMLDIYPVIVSLVEGMGLVLKEVAKHDGDLARQGRRAVLSILLNVKEGMGSDKGNRKARYFNALGSARETEAVLDGARAMGYVRQVDPIVTARLSHVVAVLVLLSRRG
jgi:four helix bundle protein